VGYAKDCVNVIEEFQTLGEQVDKLQQSANRKVAQEKIRQLLEKMRQRNAAFKKDMEQLYEAARLVTSQSKTASLGAEVWKEISENLSMALVVLNQVPKPHPSFDGLLEEHKALVRDLIDDAEQEYRSYAETAHLLKSPANAKRLSQAIEEAKSENLPVYDSADDFLKSLHDK
jgi:histone acetyltransferase (RNA polymerase elongator complex component)